VLQADQPFSFVSLEFRIDNAKSATLFIQFSDGYSITTTHALSESFGDWSLVQFSSDGQDVSDVVSLTVVFEPIPGAPEPVQVNELTVSACLELPSTTPKPTTKGTGTTPALTTPGMTTTPATKGTTAPFTCKDKKVEVNLDVANLKPSSNADNVGYLISGLGSPHNNWEPTTRDSVKTLEITLPDFNGIPAGEYPIIEVKVKPTGNLGPVTVQIFDKDGNKVFEDVYNSTPMKITSGTSGTKIILSFSEKVTGIYDLQIFTCAPRSNCHNASYNEKHNSWTCVQGQKKFSLT
jgi:hypothetical protein